MTRDDHAASIGRPRLSRRRLLRAGGALTAAVLAGCGYRPGPGDEKWSEAIPHSFSGDNTLLAGDSGLFLIDSKDRWFDPEAEAWRNGARVTAYDAGDGSETWSQQVARYAPAATSHGESVYAGLAPLSEAPESIWDSDDEPAEPPSDSLVSADRVVLGLSTDGSKRWATPIPASPVAMAADSTGAYALTEDGRLRAFDRSDGSQRWTLDVGGAGSAATVTAGGDGGPVAVVSDSVSTLTVVTRDGERGWSTDTAIGFEPAPIVGTDGIYVFDGPTLHAFELDSGSERWTERTGVPLGPPVTDDGSLYVSVAERLLALDLQSGEERWSVGGDYRFDSEAGVDVATAPAIGDGCVYVGGDYLYCLDSNDGSVRWQIDESVAFVFPRLVDGTLVIETTYDRLRAFHTG